MKKTAKCKLCDFKITANGDWQTKELILNHLKEKHSVEYFAKQTQQSQIQDEINLLKKRKAELNLWMFIE